MERLEAALQKARESRRKAQTAGGRAHPVTRTGEPAPEPAENWHKLKEFKLSNMAARRNRLSSLTGGREAGPYDLLRSRVQRLMEEKGWQSLAITSPNSACGKTTVCANLAFSLARQPDLRVLVLDLDLRRPALHKVLAQKPHDSFFEVLQGKLRAEDQLIRFGENLAFGLNAKSAPNPSELLHSKATRERLGRIREQFAPDLVLFDMPPMLATDDNVGFLPFVDCGMLVNAAESTTITQLDNCEKEMAQLTNVLGVVLNKCRFHDPENGYEYDYY